METRSILTSSNKEGRIFRVRSPSENLPKTVLRPFINETFSSRDFEVKLERSRKLSVETGNELKNGYDSKVVGVGRELAWRVINERIRSYDKIPA
jgi:hypothetical protein